MLMHLLFRLEASNEIQESSTGFQLLIATARHMRKKEQLLLIPLTIWSGLEQGFFGADFTAVKMLLFIHFLSRSIQVVLCPSSQKCLFMSIN